MAYNSEIEWTDATWNPIRARIKDDMIIRGREIFEGTWGYHCERISPGCKHCYASTMNGRMLTAWGTGLDYTVPNREKVEIFLDETELLKPLKWRKPKKIFPCSMTDWCADFVTDEMRDRMLAVAALCPQHTFLFLTKRADRCTEYFGDEFRTAYIEGAAQSIYSKLHPEESWESVSLSLAVHERNLRHCNLGFSAENQECFDARWSHMRKLAAAGWRVWCSAEPLLGPIDISAADGLSWCVVGGESGHGARPLCIDWIGSIIHQCKSARVPVFCKQLGRDPYEEREVGSAKGGCPVGLKLKDSKGGDMSEWPEDLRVREAPHA